MFYLILLFTVVPLLELAVIIKVGAYLGAIKTITLLLLTGFVGAYLARLQGFAVLQRMQTSVEEGLMPTEPLLDGFLVLAGGVLLLVPGFLTDIVGLFMVLPWPRALLKVFLRRKLNETIRRRQTVTFRRFSTFD